MLGNKLKSLTALLKVLPVSSGDCERRFSQLNLYHTSERNRLTSVNDLSMIGNIMVQFSSYAILRSLVLVG